ncbi:MAG: hypothetical protein IBX48_06770 [Thiomicrospira sp.]|uniref:hypothetical protein n=1 Tax=Thiomicrospira sp. TaxID=935 RepID=UPI0019FD3A5C|nr:hypothetical protein [Thiomicrospira sp.]MBE0494030.1 hypothetical protein [Thiomicrospira sp.]
MKSLLNLFFLISVFSLSGCIGSDSGGGDTKTGISSVTYTGKTEPATFTSAADVDALYQEYMSSGTGSMDDTFDFYNTMNSGSATTNSPVVKALSKLEPSRYTLKATQSINESAQGDCGGSASVKGSYDDVTGYLDITLTTNNYCETYYNYDYGNYSETYMNGSFRLKGNLNELELTFTAFSLKDLTDGVHVEMGGSMKMEAGSGVWETQTTANFVVKDYILDKQFKMQNYVIVSNYSSFEENGRLYHSDYGYVDVATLETLADDWYREYPTAGKIKITGTKTYIIEYSYDTYTIGEDINGDGLVDETPVTFDNPAT